MLANTPDELVKQLDEAFARWGIEAVSPSMCHGSHGTRPYRSGKTRSAPMEGIQRSLTKLVAEHGKPAL